MSISRIVARLCRGLLLVVALSAVAIGEARTTTTQPQRLQLLEALRHGQYQELDEALSGYQREFEAGRLSESAVADAFLAFTHADRALEPRFEEWLRRVPESYAARLARAIYYWQCGLFARGDDWFKDTPEARLDGMRKFFAHARPDLERVVAERPRLTTATAVLVYVSRTSGSYQEAFSLAQPTLALERRSPLLHRAFLDSVGPKWGGSLYNVREYVSSLRKNFPTDPALKPLLMYDDFVVGETARVEKRYEDAEAHFDRIAVATNDPAYRLLRGRMRLQLMRIAEAEADFTALDQAAPHSAEIHFFLAKTAGARGQLDRAMAHLDKAIRLAGLDPLYLQTRAFAHMQALRYLEAERDLRDALVFGSYDPAIHMLMSRLYTRMARWPQAVDAAVKAVEIAPALGLPWLHYAAALYVNRDCKVVPAFRTFRDLCAADSSCGLEKEWGIEAGIPLLFCDDAPKK